MITVIEGLEAFCRERGVSRLMDIKGAVGAVAESAGDLTAMDHEAAEAV